MTVAAIDRLVHHSTIFENKVESYRAAKPSIESVDPAAQPSTLQPKKPRPPMVDCRWPSIKALVKIVPATMIMSLGRLVSS